MLFARWQAIQELAQQTLCAPSATEADLQVLITVWKQLLQDKQLSPAYLSRALALPSVRQLLAQQRPMDPHALTQKHRHIEQQLAQHFQQTWLTLYQQLTQRLPTQYRPCASDAGLRALRNLVLKQLVLAQHPDAFALAQEQYQKQII